MSAVLRKLQREVFVLSLRDSILQAPDLPGFDVSLRDDADLEVAIGVGHTLNDLFAALSKHNIDVVSLRNKSNRLEELFMRLVENKQSHKLKAERL